MDRKNTFKRAVNLVTVLGGGMSAGALFFVFAGEAYLRTAWLCLGIGLLIDSIDGTVVRVLGLDQSLPRYDGERLDEYADLVTYVVAPVGFAWGADLLPADWFGFVTGVVLCAASMLQFSRTDNKTENAFWGWPSYWNVFFFYAWALELPPYPTAVASWVLGACVFAPIPFAYPSKFPVLRKVTWVLAGVWMMTLLLYLISPEFDQIWLIGSLAFPVYYLAISGYFHEELAD